MSFIFAYTTHPDIKTAEKITERLLKKKIIACANIFPIKSMYSWKGKIEKNNETVCIFKTRQQNWEKIKQEIAEIHPYDVPCIIKINVEANNDFTRWIENETS